MDYTDEQLDKKADELGVPKEMRDQWKQIAYGPARAAQAKQRSLEQMDLPDAFDASRGQAQSARAENKQPQMPGGITKTPMQGDEPHPQDDQQAVMAGGRYQLRDAPVVQSAGTLVPGGWQPHSRSAQVQSAVGVDPEARELGDQASDRERNAVGRMDAAERLQTAQEADFLDRQDRLQELRAQNQRDRNEDRQRRVDVEMQKLGQLTDAANAGKIDPDQLSHERGFLGNLVAAISVGLGGLGQGMAGLGSNPALDVLNRQIDRNIQAQKDNINQKHAAVDEQRGLIAQLQKNGMNEDQAESAAWNMYLDQAKTQIAKIAAGTKDQAIQARSQQMLAAIDKEQADRLQKYREASTDKVIRKEQDAYRPAQWVGGGTGGKADSALSVHMPDGTVRIAADAESARKGRAAVVFQTKMKSIDQEALKFRELRKQALKSQDWKAAASYDDTLKQIQQDRIYTLSTAQEQGVVRDAEFIREAKVVDVASFDWNPLTAGHTKQFLTDEQGRFDRIMENEVRTWAPEVAQHSYAVDASGGLKPQNTYTGEAKAPPKYVQPPSFKGVK